MAEENKAMELHGEESEKKKYISDVLDIDKLIEEYGNKIMLIAGVGSGKSTWVKDVLTQKGNVLFITSRRAKVDDLKLAILEALYGENPTVEEFLAFMYVVVQKDLKEDLKKTAS